MERRIPNGQDVVSSDENLEEIESLFHNLWSEYNERESQTLGYRRLNISHHINQINDTIETNLRESFVNTRQSRTNSCTFPWTWFLLQCIVGVLNIAFFYTHFEDDLFISQPPVAILWMTVSFFVPLNTSALIISWPQFHMRVLISFCLVTNLIVWALITDQMDRQSNVKHYSIDSQATILVFMCLVAVSILTFIILLLSRPQRKLIYIYAIVTVLCISTLTYVLLVEQPRDHAFLPYKPKVKIKRRNFAEGAFKKNNSNF